MPEAVPANPPTDVLDYFRGKKLRPGYSWLDVFGQEHAHAFTVAKAVEIELLQSFRASIDKAIAEGVTFEEWRKGLEPELRRLGWWGPRSVVDPESGKRTTVDFSSPRRLKNIFWSNMRAARAAAQWQRAQATKDVLPFILYVETTADDPREEHLDWVGTILPVDHPFWHTHWPPNGWGCKCSVRQIGRVEAARRGGVSPDPVVQTKTFRNKRTGEEIEVPVGIDNGWHTNPGLSRSLSLGRVLAEKVERITDASLRKLAIERITESDTFAQIVVGKAPQKLAMPFAEISGAAAEALRSRNSVVLLSSETALKNKLKHPELAVYHYDKLLDVLKDADIIAREKSLNLIVEIDGVRWLAVVKRTEDGSELYLTSFRRVHDRDIARLRRRAMELRPDENEE